MQPPKSSPAPEPKAAPVKTTPQADASADEAEKPKKKKKNKLPLTLKLVGVAGIAGCSLWLYAKPPAAPTPGDFREAVAPHFPDYVKNKDKGGTLTVETLDCHQSYIATTYSCKFSMWYQSGRDPNVSGEVHGDQTIQRSANGRWLPVPNRDSSNDVVTPNWPDFSHSKKGSGPAPQ